jgi:hypothetical protein
MPRSDDPESPVVQIHPRLPRFAVERLAELAKEVRPYGFLHMNNEDIIGALIDSATVVQVAKALKPYTPKAGAALVEQERHEAKKAASG